MGPVKTPVPVSFAGGLDTKTDPKQVIPGKLLALENGIFQNAGAINKRWGYEALGQTILGSPAPIASCFALNVFNNELLLYDGQNAYSYSISRNAWMGRGSVVSLIQTNQQIIAGNNQQLSPDFGSLDGTEVYAWEDSRGGIRYSVVDAESGSFLLVDQPLFTTMPSTIARPKVLAFQGELLVFYTTVSGQLGFVAINPLNPTAVATTGVIVLNGLATPVFYDACVSGQQIFLAYYTATAVMLAALGQTPQTVLWNQAVASQSSVPTGVLNVTGDVGGNAWVTYADSGTGSQSCSTAVYASGGTQWLAPTQLVSQSTGALASVAGVVVGSTLTVFAEATGSETYNAVLYSNTLTLLGEATIANDPRVVGYLNPSHESSWTLGGGNEVLSAPNLGSAGGNWVPGTNAQYAGQGLGPTYGSTALDGSPGLTFTGSSATTLKLNSIGSAFDVADGTPTIAIFAQLLPTILNRADIVTVGNTSPSYNGQLVYMNTEGAEPFATSPPFDYAFGWQDVNGDYLAARPSTQTAVADTLTPSSLVIRGTTSGAGTVTEYLGNASYSDTEVSSPPATAGFTANQIVLGARPDGVATTDGNAEYFTGVLGVVLIVSGDLTPTDIANFNTFVANPVATSATLGAPAASAPVFKRSVGLASKPFVYNGAIYVHAAFQSNLQSTYFTLDGAGREIGRVQPGNCGGLVANSDYVLPECVQVSNGVFKYANLLRAAPNSEAGVVFALLGVNATKVDFFDSNHFLSVAINGSLYTVGGIPQSYDGAEYVECGFNVYPEGIVATPETSGGSMADGTYNYVVTYEWTDNQDLTLPSTPSVAIEVTVAGGGGDGSVVFTIPTLRLTKKSNVKVVVYRTTASGVLLYRVTSAASPLYNDPLVDSVSFTDTLADATIQSNALCYTQPLVQNGTDQILPNAPPPSSSLICTYADRIFLAGLDDGLTIAFSQQTAPNAPMQFAEDLTLRIDPLGGAITAIVQMGPYLIVFKEFAIFYIVGQGPTATGDQNDFTTFINIPSSGVGCVNANSIVLTSIGLLFESANGIYLLDPGLNVTYKGAPVEAFNALDITSATLIPNQWVVFTTSSETAIVYDYLFDQWSTFTNHAAVDSAIFQGNDGLFVYANAAGEIFQQTPGVFSDDGQPIVLSMTTAWLNPGVIQGYQRVYHAFLLGTYKGTHDLSVWIAFDYDTSPIALSTIPVDATLGVTTFGSTSPFGEDAYFGGADPGQSVYQFRLDVLKKCQAIQFTISDEESAPGNEGFSLSALTLIVGVKQGGNKVPAAKQFGAT